MRREYRTFTALCIIGILTACPGESSTGPGGGRGISTDAEAKAAFAYLKAAAGYVDQQVPTHFTAPLTVSGATGTVSVSGTKTSSSTSSSSSSSSTSTSDLSLEFLDYRSSTGAGTLTGVVDWYDYYYSRTACSSSTCASASDHSEAMEGSSIRITFEYDGRTYSDEIIVDAYSDSDVSSWDVDITNRKGERFSFTAW